MQKKISLLDSGATNLHSIYKALRYIGADVTITNDEFFVKNSDGLVFPGVGAFGSVISCVRKNNLEKIITDALKAKKLFLGICVGMQALFESSEENPEVKGLGILKGKVIKFKKARKVPHIGWNTANVVESLHATTLQSNQFYFLHSYYVVPEDKNIIYRETEYDSEKFVSAVKKENLLAVEFHPQKSGDAGLELLRNFINN